MKTMVLEKILLVGILVDLLKIVENVKELLKKQREMDSIKLVVAMYHFEVRTLLNENVTIIVPDVDQVVKTSMVLMCSLL